MRTSQRTRLVPRLVRARQTHRDKSRRR
jgi:hypothetical protein